MNTKKTIEILNSLKSHYTKDGIFEKGLSSAIDKLEATLWHKVSSASKPEGEVLATDEHGYIFVADFECGTKETNNGFVNCEDIYGYYEFATHWMELPKPPKGERT